MCLVARLPAEVHQPIKLRPRSWPAVCGLEPDCTLPGRALPACGGLLGGRLHRGAPPAPAHGASPEHAAQEQPACSCCSSCFTPADPVGWMSNRRLPAAGGMLSCAALAAHPRPQPACTCAGLHARAAGVRKPAQGAVLPGRGLPSHVQGSHACGALRWGGAGQQWQGVEAAWRWFEAAVRPLASSALLAGALHPSTYLARLPPRCRCWSGATR